MPGVPVPQMKHRGVASGVELVILAVQVLVASVVPVEPAGHELVESEEPITEHRRLPGRRRCCRGSYGRYGRSHNS